MTGDPQYVDMVFHEPELVSYRKGVSESITKPSKGWQGYAGRFAIWLLEKVGAWNNIEHTEYRRLTFKKDTFLERLNEKIDMFHRCERQGPKRVLIGQQDFDELMPEVAQNEYRPGSPWSFETKIARGYKNQYGQTEVFYYGLPIEVIPTMRGILVL